MRRIHIGLATVHQHAAEATFQHQLHLLRYHRRVIDFQRGQQLVGEVMRRPFLLIRQLVNRMARVRKISAGGDEQTTRVAVVADAFRQRGIARQQLLLRGQLFIQHQLSAPDINLLAEIAQGIIE